VWGVANFFVFNLDNLDNLDSSLWELAEEDEVVSQNDVLRTMQAEWRRCFARLQPTNSMKTADLESGVIQRVSDKPAE